MQAYLYGFLVFAKLSWSWSEENSCFSRPGQITLIWRICRTPSEWMWSLRYTHTGKDEPRRPPSFRIIFACQNGFPVLWPFPAIIASTRMMFLCCSLHHFPSLLALINFSLFWPPLSSLWGWLHMVGHQLYWGTVGWKKAVHFHVFPHAQIFSKWSQSEWVGMSGWHRAQWQPPAPGMQQAGYGSGLQHGTVFLSSKNLPLSEGWGGHANERKTASVGSHTVWLKNNSFGRNRLEN